MRKWFYLFWTTLLIGAGGAVIAGLALQIGNGGIQFKGTADLLLYSLILLGYGVLVSVYAQLGFFAYLILNYTGIGVFPRKAWRYIQLVLAVLALFEPDVPAHLCQRRPERPDGFDARCGYSVHCTYRILAQNAQHERVSLGPDLFFMTAITIVEIIGVLRIGVDNATIFILVPLIACNAFQILMLHRVLKPATI